MALDGKSVDAMVVGGIGAGAITKLNAMGVKVYAAAASTVKENLELLSRKQASGAFCKQCMPSSSGRMRTLKQT